MSIRIALALCAALLSCHSQAAHLQDSVPGSAASAPAVSQDLPPEGLAELAATVRGYVEEGAIVGAELLVIKNRHTVLHEAVGWRDREEQTLMERNTIFNIRSMTKPLVAAAVQMLVDEGRLALGDRVSEYLPGFAGGASGEITIEHLLTHRSGLPVSIVSRLDEYESLYAMANAAGERGVQFAPGSRFWYSDAGADVLGAVVERVAGMPLEEFLRLRLFEPLYMSDTRAARSR
jgi:CubicO group peptidase (beta-lactamase class C family)